MATVIFTDSYVYDTEKSVANLRTLTEVGPVVLFCVENRLDKEFIDAVRSLPKPVRIVVHRPGQPLIDEALEVFDMEKTVTFKCSDEDVLRPAHRTGHLRDVIRHACETIGALSAR